MAVYAKQTTENNLLVVEIVGKLLKSDYEYFVPIFEELIERYGKLRVLVEVDEFLGWTAGALWEDIKFDIKHFKDIEKLAIVGDSKWQRGMAAFCRPFTTAEIKYFPIEDRGAAMEWLDEASVSAG